VIKITVTVECRDERIAARVQNVFKLDDLLSWDGVLAVSGTWTAEADE